MTLTKKHSETHFVGNVTVMLLWKSFLGINYARQIRIYRDGVWVV